MADDDFAVGDDILEKRLQVWFEQISKPPCQLAGYINNRTDLDATYEQLMTSKRAADKATLDGLMRAREICSMLDNEPMLLAANKSIAPRSASQMRPDLILFTESANYILIELKKAAKQKSESTKKTSGSERQGVQELLAYGAAAKLQVPFVNEFVYVMVAKDWSDLLRLSVQSLILDGKFVLPLEWQFDSVAGFSLSVRLELFNLKMEQHYPPLYAMVPNNLGVELELPGMDERLRHYLTWRAHEFHQKCEQLHQTGFAIVWHTVDDEVPEELWNLTVATVNQYWHHSEGLPSSYDFPLPDNPGSLHKLNYTKYRKTYRETLASYGSNVPKDERFWGQCAAYQDASVFYPQSSLSYDILNRVRDQKEETFLRDNQIVFDFDTDSFLNLSHFLRYLEKYEPHMIRIELIRTFGELKEYIDFIDQLRPRKGPYHIKEFIEKMRGFHEHKERQAANREEPR